MRAQVRAVFSRITTYQNRTWVYMAEYNNRARLRRIGFTTSTDDLDALTAQLFIVIADEIDKLEEAERRRISERAKGNRR